MLKTGPSGFGLTDHDQRSLIGSVGNLTTKGERTVLKCILIMVDGDGTIFGVLLVDVTFVK